jgi:hypothetical protein
VSDDAPSQRIDTLRWRVSLRMRAQRFDACWRYVSMRVGDGARCVLAMLCMCMLALSLCHCWREVHTAFCIFAFSLQTRGDIIFIIIIIIFINNFSFQLNPPVNPPHPRCGKQKSAKMQNAVFFVKFSCAPYKLP